MAADQGGNGDYLVASTVLQSLHVSPTTINVVVKDTYGNPANQKTDLTGTNPEQSKATKNNAIGNGWAC